MKRERAAENIAQQQDALPPTDVPDFPIRARGVGRMIALYREELSIAAHSAT